MQMTEEEIMRLPHEQRIRVLTMRDNILAERNRAAAGFGRDSFRGGYDAPRGQFDGAPRVGGGSFDGGVRGQYSNGFPSGSSGRFLPDDPRDQFRR